MERFDLYTGERVKTGETLVRGTKPPKGRYRVVVHVCVFNSKGQMLIQQRQPFKKGWSNLWDLTVGGSSQAGDSSQSAAEREFAEELGYEISLENERPALTINFEGGFNDVYIVEKDIDISKLKLQEEEVKAVKWATKEEIIKLIENETFIPYNKGYIELLFHMKNHDGTFTRQDKKKGRD